jgi:hypothetical protein
MERSRFLAKRESRAGHIASLAKHHTPKAGWWRSRLGEIFQCRNANPDASFRCHFVAAKLESDASVRNWQAGPGRLSFASDPGRVTLADKKAPFWPSDNPFSIGSER